MLNKRYETMVAKKLYLNTQTPHAASLQQDKNGCLKPPDPKTCIPSALRSVVVAVLTADIVLLRAGLRTHHHHHSSPPPSITIITIQVRLKKISPP